MPGLVHQKGFSDADLVDFLRRLRNHSHSVAGTLPNLAPATVTTNIKSAQIIAAIVDGTPIMKAASDPIVTLSGASGTATAAGQSTVYLIEMDATGTVTVKQGPIVVGSASDTIQSVPLPVPTPGRCTIGYILIKGIVFTPGTTTVTAGMLNDGDPYLLPGVNLAGIGNVGLVS